MNDEMKRLALKQYLHYFRIWFVLVALVLLVTIGIAVGKNIVRNMPRGNDVADTERVFDYADILTDTEEAKLREYIAECERKAHIDIVLVTMDTYMGESDAEWEYAMMNIADDFYDNGKYGWNQPYGDGALILDNWYVDENGSQQGTWLSTSGKMEETIGYYEEDQVLDEIYDYIDSDPYKAYYEGIRRLASYGQHGYNDSVDISGMCCALILPIIIALVFATSNLKQAAAQDTTTATTYVPNGNRAMRKQTDNFIRKNVVSHRIESTSSSGGGSHHSGGGSHGSHHSSGGHSHGGGGRRR